MSDFRFKDDPALNQPEADNKPEAEKTAPVTPPQTPEAAPVDATPPAAPQVAPQAASPSATPSGFSFVLPAELESPATPAKPAPAKPTAATQPVASPPLPAAPTSPPVSAPAAQASVVPPLPDLNTLKATPPTTRPPAPAATTPATPPKASAPVVVPPRPVPPATPQAIPPATGASTPSAPRAPQAPPQGAQAPQAPQTPRPPQTGQTTGQPAAPQGARNPQSPVPPGTARPPQAPQAPVPPVAAGPRPPQPPGRPSGPTAPTPPTGPQSAPNQVAAYAAANVQGEARETGGLQKTLWSLDGLVDRYSQYLDYVLYVGGGGALLCLIFLATKLFGGKGTAIEVGSKLMSNINTAGQMLGAMLILVAIGGIFSIWTQKGAGIAMTVVGLLVFFGIPFLLPSQFGVYHPQKNQALSAYASGQLIGACHIGGIGMLVVGLLKYLIEVILWILEMPDRMMKKASVGAGQQIEAAQQRVAKSANALSPCWSLPFCREVIRKQCPAFLARKTCWKFKRGCYCDDEMIARIIRGESIEKIKAPTKMSQLRKPPCGRCYIYMEHQSYKFRMISPLTIPITVAIMVAVWNPFGQVFAPIYIKLDEMQKNLKFFQTPNPIEASAEDVKAVQDLGAVDQEKSLAFTQWFIGLILGFLLLVYISKFMEWAVFEAKW